ncbi:hypothetical protein HDU91_006716 [Kappamyces sp. JEL0680]|nr:hypothetical protein HDU91_006716 [Kappamyces sp. JEL0680]
MFNPDEEAFDVHSHLKPFNGSFYSGARIFLKDKILGLSSTCSELFPSDSGSFLWEAVRCARSSGGSNCLLVKPKGWIIELMIPWCQYVNLGAINIDMVNAEYFRFLMDSAFDDPNQNDDIVNCWGEVSRSQDYGVVNAAVLMDVVVEVSARFTALETPTLIMASTLSSIQPDLVSTVLAFHLSSSAFPWHQTKSSHSFQHTSHLAIKEYIASLHSSYNITPPESENGYRLNCQSSTRLVSQILPQRFEFFATHMSILINYILVHLEGSFKKSSAGPILQGCIYGFISFLHATDNVYNQQYERSQVLARKFLGWLEMEDAQVTWNLENQGFQISEIPIDQFTESLISIFGIDNTNLRSEIIQETLRWASEGFLGHEETLHAIKAYYVLLLPEADIAPSLFNLLLPRLLDQISILSQLELEAKTARPGDKASGWSSLPKGKLSLRSNSVEIIMAILKVHSILLEKFVMEGTIESNGKLFWATMGLLNISSKDFPEIVLAALENVLFMFNHLDRAKLDNYFLFPLEASSERSCEVQSLIIPILFGDSPILQDKALVILLNSWIVFPPATVDNNKTGLLYTVLYSLTWLFVRIFQHESSKPTFFVVVKKLEEFLLIYFPTELDELQHGLSQMREVLAPATVSAEVQDLLFQRCFGNVLQYFALDFGNNIAQYVGQIISLSSPYRQVGLRVAQLLWHSSLRQEKHAHSLNALRNLLRSVPFIKVTDQVTEELLLQTFDSPNGDLIKEIDVASQGRVEPMPEFEIFQGSVRAAWNWLSNDIGISPSNRLFSMTM